MAKVNKCKYFQLYCVIIIGFYIMIDNTLDYSVSI